MTQSPPTLMSDSTETTLYDRFLAALETSGNPDLAAVAAATRQQEQEEEKTPPCVMKWTLKQDDLLRALMIVMKTVSTRSTLPILGHFLLVTRPSELETVPSQVVHWNKFGNGNVDSG